MGREPRQRATHARQPGWRGSTFAAALFLHGLPIVGAMFAIVAGQAIVEAIFSQQRVLSFSPWWDLVTVGWSAAAIGAATMALWSSKNLRCPRCRGSMTAHESVGGVGALVLAMFGADNAPHQSCRACDLEAPLRSPRSPVLWSFAAVACGGVLVAVYAQRAHAVTRFVNWFVG